VNATGSTTEANKAIVMRIFDEVLSGGDFTVSDELVAPDSKFFTHARPEPFVGPQGFREYIGAVRKGMPDTKVEVHQLVAEDDTVVAFWTLHGTHTDNLLGIPPLGNRIALDALEWVRLRDGKLVEIRLTMDTIGLMRQLGVLPGGAGPNLPLPLVAMVHAKRLTRKLKRRFAK
jgi:steroid delta-isomerase-like uncharacterized protein